MPIYTKYPLDESHPVNLEIKIYEKLNKFNNPHIPTLFTNLRCNYQDVLKPDTDIYKEYQKKVEDRSINEELNIMLLELSDYGTFHDYAQKYKHDSNRLKAAFFQIYYVIVFTQQKIPFFRHNDLHSNNILLGRYHFPGEIEYINKLKKTHLLKLYICYIMFGKKYYIPYYGNCIKMIDFDVSCGKGFPNSKVELDDVYPENGVVCEEGKGRPEFDSHLSTNSSVGSLIPEGKLITPMAGGGIKDLHDDIIDFVNRNFPSKYIGDTEYLGYARIKDHKNFPKIPSAIELLLDEMFELFLEEKEKKVIYTIDTKIPPIKKLKKKSPSIFSY